jgi:hypothetical protein
VRLEELRLMKNAMTSPGIEIATYQLNLGNLNFTKRNFKREDKGRVHDLNNLIAIP